MRNKVLERQTPVVSNQGERSIRIPWAHYTTLQTVHLLTSSYPQDIGTKTKTEPQKTYSAPGFPFQKGRNSREGENSEVTGNSRKTMRKENGGSFVTILKQFCVTPLAHSPL